MSRRENLEELKAHLTEIDRALSHGEWWLNRSREEPRLTVARTGRGALTKAQEADRDAFVAKRMSRQRGRRS